MSRIAKEKPDYHCICEVCKKEFKHKNPLARVCSISCRNSLNAKNSNKNRNYPERPCEECKNLYIPHSTHQKFCSDKCHKHYLYIKYIDRNKRNDRKKVSKLRIGLNIRDETMQTPSNPAKWLWDGIGKWSVKYWPDIQECLECNTSVYKHSANGVCEYCYDKLRHKDQDRIKELKKRAYEKAKASGKQSSAQQAREWIQKAKDKKIPITPKISNLLDNLERL